MYDYIISQMVWSFSRISAFHECPYRFFMRYICAEDDVAPMFFAGYGSFIHSILCDFYTGRISRDEAVTRYLKDFQKSVNGSAPSPDIFGNYFRQGLSFLQNMQPFDGTVLDAERRVSFSVDGFPFVGFVDMICRNPRGELCIVDHKSRSLKPRSNRKKPTKSDEELDRYLRQLYLYSIAAFDIYGEYPTQLMFNCFRTGEMIVEPFRQDGFDEAKQWAVESIRAIQTQAKWWPNYDFFRCKHLCGLNSGCEYYQMMGGGRY